MYHCVCPCDVIVVIDWAKGCLGYDNDGDDDGDERNVRLEMGDDVDDEQEEKMEE